VKIRTGTRVAMRAGIGTNPRGDMMQGNLSVMGSKGIYVCIRPHRYMYRNYRNTVANMDESDSMCRYIGKIIARDLRFVASGLYKMAITRPRVMCRHYIVTLVRCRPPGLYKPYKRREKESNALNNHAAYVLVQTQKSHYRLAPCGSFSVDLACRETPHPIE